MACTKEFLQDCFAEIKYKSDHFLMQWDYKNLS